MSMIPCGSSPVVGSSSTMRSGWCRRVWAIPSRWRMPCENPPTRSFSRPARPTKSSISRISCELEGLPEMREKSWRFLKADRYL